jgi:hypothetical protein
MKRSKRRIVLTLIGLMVLITGVSVTTAAKTENVRWYGYEDGLKKGKEEGKSVYIHFYSDICQYCKEMESTTFTNQKVVKQLNSKFIPIRVNSDKEYKIAYKYNIRPVPDNWIFNKKGERIYRQLGYIDASTFSSVLKKMGK